MEKLQEKNESLDYGEQEEPISNDNCSFKLKKYHLVRKLINKNVVFSFWKSLQRVSWYGNFKKETGLSCRKSPKVTPHESKIEKINLETKSTKMVIFSEKLSQKCTTVGGLPKGGEIPGSNDEKLSLFFGQKLTVFPVLLF